MRTMALLLVLLTCVLNYAGGTIFDMNNPPAGTVRIIGGNPQGETGYAVRTIGDFSGDGIPDFAISSPLDNRVYILFGRRNYPPVINLSFLATNGFAVNGNDNSGFGWSLGAPGDVNRDGRADLLIGAPFEGAGGRVYLLKGTFNLLPIHVTNEDKFLLILEGADGESLGQVLGDGGDINDDASSDLLIPSPYFVGESNNQPVVGAAYIVYGQTSYENKIINTQSLDQSSTLTLYGPKTPEGYINTFFGGVMEMIGDFDGNLFPDVGLFQGVTFREPQDPNQPATESEASLRVIPGGGELTGAFRVDELPFATGKIVFRLFENSEAHEITQLQSSDVDQDGAPELFCAFPHASLTGNQPGSGVVALVHQAGAGASEIIITPDNLATHSLFGIPQGNAGFGTRIASLRQGIAVSAIQGSHPSGTGGMQGGVYIIKDLRPLLGKTVLDVLPFSAPVYFGRAAGDLFGIALDGLDIVDKQGVEPVLVSTREGGDNPASAYILPSMAEETGIFDFRMY
ncbi:MAG: integrin alpha [bacterium]